MGLNWISRVIGDYFQLFDMAFWFWWLLCVLACKIQPLEASKLIILVKKSPKMGHPFIEKKKKDGHGKSLKQDFDDFPWPSFNMYENTSHDHFFVKISPFLGIFWPKCWDLRPLQGVLYMLEHVGAIRTKIPYWKVKNNH